jgi:hypothetical protein
MSVNTKPQYAWRATYDDGTVISWNSVVGFSYNDLNRAKLRVFEIVSKESGETALKVELEKGDRLIWRNMTTIATGKGAEIVQMVGKQRTIEGKNVQWVALFFEKDKKVEFFDRFDEKHTFLRGVKLLPFEEWVE